MKFNKKIILSINLLPIIPLMGLSAKINEKENRNLNWWEFHDNTYISLLTDIINNKGWMSVEGEYKNLVVPKNKDGNNFRPSYFKDIKKINQIQNFLPSNLLTLIQKINTTYAPEKEEIVYSNKLSENFVKILDTRNIYSIFEQPNEWKNKIEKFFKSFSLKDRNGKIFEKINWNAVEWKRKNEESLEGIFYFEKEPNTKKWQAIKLEFELRNSVDIFVRLAEAKVITKEILSNKNWWNVGQKVNLDNTSNDDWISVNSLFFEINFNKDNKKSLYFLSEIKFDQDTIFDEEKGEIRNLIWHTTDFSIFQNLNFNHNKYKERFNLSGFKKTNLNEEARLKKLNKINSYKYEIDLTWSHNGVKYYPWTNGYSYSYLEPGFQKIEYYNELKLIVLKFANGWYILNNFRINDSSWNWISWNWVAPGTLFTEEHVKKNTQWDVFSKNMQYTQDSGWVPLDPSFRFYNYSKGSEMTLQISKFGSKWGGYYATKNSSSNSYEVRYWKKGISK